MLVLVVKCKKNVYFFLQNIQLKIDVVDFFKEMFQVCNYWFELYKEFFICELNVIIVCIVSLYNISMGLNE